MRHKLSKIPPHTASDRLSYHTSNFCSADHSRVRHADTIDISYTLDDASHTVSWRIAGAGRSHRVEKEHDNLCIFISEVDKVDNKSSFMQLKSI